MGSTILYSVARKNYWVGLYLRRDLYEKSEWVRGTVRGRVFQTQEIASAKTFGQDCAWWAQELERKLVCVMFETDRQIVAENEIRNHKKLCHAL